MKAIGELLPMAPRGRSSLWHLRQFSNYFRASARVRGHSRPDVPLVERIDKEPPLILQPLRRMNESLLLYSMP